MPTTATVPTAIATATFPDSAAMPMPAAVNPACATTHAATDRTGDQPRSTSWSYTCPRSPWSNGRCARMRRTIATVVSATGTATNSNAPLTTAAWRCEAARNNTASAAPSR